MPKKRDNANSEYQKDAAPLTGLFAEADISPTQTRLRALLALYPAGRELRAWCPGWQPCRVVSAAPEGTTVRVTVATPFGNLTLLPADLQQTDETIDLSDTPA